VKAVFFKTIVFLFPLDFAEEANDFLLEISPKARLFILAPGVENDVVDCLAEDVVFMTFSLDTSGRMEVEVEEDVGRAVDRGANMIVQVA